MPKACVIAKPGCFGSDETERAVLARSLQRVIAEVLTCEDLGGELGPQDVEVEVRDRMPGRDFGEEEYEVQVTVLANKFPSRLANQDERARSLNKRVKKLLPKGTKGYIWLHLDDAVFVEF